MPEREESDDLDALLADWRKNGISGQLPTDSGYIALNEIYLGLRDGGFTETQSLRIIAVLLAENGERANDKEQE